VSLFQVVGLNFSSATTPELLLKTFDHYCEYRRTPNGVVLAPVQLGKWLVLFCDEINLPDMDKYGTQRVISFIRQVCSYPQDSPPPSRFLIYILLLIVLYSFPSDGGTRGLLSYLRPNMGKTGENPVCWSL
jgi:hypothetical protein